MKLVLMTVLTFFCYLNVQGQSKETPAAEGLLKELAEDACKCVDSISVGDKSQEEIGKEANACISKKTLAYQLGVKMLNIKELQKSAVEDEDGKKRINISVEMNEESSEYKKFYYEIERYMMENCKSLKDKMRVLDKQNEKSVSNNEEALKAYSKGIAELEKEGYKKALVHFENAVKIDPKFAFAWDNVGICYRKLGDYDKALNAYKKSLEIDPQGMMPLQNIAIVYMYKKEYTKAINAYENLAKIDKNNPEVYYGIGQIYATNLKNYEKGLENMCKAYILYVEQKSPYRTDAEKMIQMIFSAMKKEGKEDRFNEILKEHHISGN